MIKEIPDLLRDVEDVIKVKPNTDPTKTQGIRVRTLLSDILDTLQNLVVTLGSSVSTIQGLVTTQSTKLTSIQELVTNIQLLTQNYNELALKSELSTLPDFTKFLLKSDKIPYSNILNTPTLFSGSYSDLTGKPALFSGNYSDLLNKPTIPSAPDLSPYAKKSDIVTYDLSGYQKTSDTIPYSRLSGTPTIPSYDLSIYRKNTDSISYTELINKPTLFDGSYTSLSNKPTIVTDYAQLVNKPSMSKLLWNQTSPFNYSNTVVETNVLLSANGNGTLNIEANPLVGTGFRFTGRGIFNTQAITSPTLTIKLYLGNTVIATGSVSSLLLSAVNKPLSFYIDILIAGTNSVYTQGSMTYFGSTADILSAAPITNNGVNTTVDLSVINQLKMTLTWSVASTANVILMKIVNLEKLN